MRKLSVLFACALAIQLSYAQVTFIENKGQWDKYILYRQQLHQGEFLFAKDRFVYYLVEDKENPFMEHGHTQHTTSHSPEDYVYQSHIYQARFVNANTEVKIIPNQASPALFNYYQGNDASHWATGVRAYQQVTYHQLYQGIDMQVYGNEHLKYDFIVQPHVSPNQIQINYEGVDKVSLDENGNLKIRTSVTTVTELAPTAYQIIDGKKQVVACTFSLLDNTVSFHFPQNYNHNYPLTIDPAIVFSTYTGSTQDNWGFTATGEKGKAIGGGVIYNSGFLSIGSTGYPVLGAFQNSFQGGEEDAAITRYTANGANLIFSTYIGGSLSDQPHSIAIASNKNIYVLGRTDSPDFPMIGNGYDASFNGSFDLFVLRFDSLGVLLNTTYLGGSYDDGVNVSESNILFTNTRYNYGDDSRGRVMIDKDGNCFIAACTRSNNFPTTTNNLQNTLKGMQDGCIVKLSQNLGSLLYSTYLGGDTYDAIYDIEVDKQGNMYVTGGTDSPNFPTTSGTLHTTFQGNIDGFISKINDTGDTLLASTYIGTSAYDQSYFLEIDNATNIYVFGQTAGNMPMINANYGQANSSQFVSCLASDLSSYIFNTTIGVSGNNLPNISPACFQIDRCNNLYLSGWGGDLIGTGLNSNCIGLPTSPNTYDATTNGNDFYFGVIEAGANSLLYGTFFGGTSLEEHVDGGTSTIDEDGVLYQAVCAGCGGSDAFPTTPGVWSNTNNSTNCNLGVVVFNLNSNCNPTNLGNTAISQPNSIKLFPNPTNGNLSLQNLPQNATISVYDMVGKKYVSLNTNESDLTLSLPSTLNGWAIITITTETTQQSVKVLVTQ